MLAPGDLAPELGLPDADGRVWTLADLGGRPSVIAFYPKDGTPGCTRELCAFRDAPVALAAAQFLAISRDNADSHRAFASQHRLPFPLLADVSGEVSKAYNAMSGLPFMRNNRRITYVIDYRCQVAHIFDPVQVDGHADEILKVLAQLR